MTDLEIETLLAELKDTKPRLYAAISYIESFASEEA